jgi:hypothetical protein
MRSLSGPPSAIEVFLTALGVGAICFFISVYVLVAIALHIGLIKIHLFEARPPSIWREDIAEIAILGFSLFAALSVATLIFRLGKKSMVRRPK